MKPASACNFELVPQLRLGTHDFETPLPIDSNLHHAQRMKQSFGELRSQAEPGNEMRYARLEITARIDLARRDIASSIRAGSRTPKLRRIWLFGRCSIGPA